MTTISDPKVSIKSIQIPVINFRESLEKVKKIYKADGLSGSPKETALNHMGYSGINGASSKVFATLKRFDLIKEDRGRVLITENGKNILVLPENDNRRKESLKACALSPRMYSELYNLYKEHGLPSDEAIKGDLILKYNLTEKLGSNIVKDFKESLAFADIKFNNSENEEDIEKVDPKEESLNPNLSLSEVVPKLNLTHPIDSIKVDLQNYRIPRKGGKFANLQLESPVSNEDIEAILKWLEVLKFTIVEESEENG